MTTQTVFATAGSTSNTFDIALVQKAAATSPGDPITGLAYNTASFTAYQRSGPTTTSTAITLATQTVGGAYSSGGFVEIDATHMPGSYRFDVPNAVVATVGESNVVFNGAANLETHTLKIVVQPRFGLVDYGTAQSATGTTIVLRSATSFSDNELVGATVVITGGTTGVGERRLITANVSSTKTCTVDTWTTTPTGTITYEIYASAPSSASSAIAANVTQWSGQNVVSPSTAGIPEVNVKNIANQAATAAAGVTFPSSIASPTNITAGTITTVTNLTNAPTNGDLTATMKTSVTTACTASTPTAAAVTGAVGSVTAAVTVGTNNDKTGYRMSATGVGDIVDAALTEPSAVFSWGAATLRNVLAYIGAKASNKQLETASSYVLRNRADTTNISTGTTSDDGTTASKSSDT